MHVLHYARRSLYLLSLATVTLAGCGKDNGPSEFNPQGASDDMAAAQSAFGSSVAASFAAAGTDISVALGGSAAVASSAQLALSRPARTERYTRAVTSLFRSSPGIQAMVVAIPTSVAGKTFIYDTASDTYIASDLTGAPSNGVRFMLYAVNPLTLRPAEPLNEVGYVDIVDESGSTTSAFHVTVVSDGLTYLDYNASASGTASGGVVTVSGFASDGSTRANFTVQNTITQNANELDIALDYDLRVPSRDFVVGYQASFAAASGAAVQATVDFSIAGRNGNLSLTGSYSDDGGSFTVKVNGETYATVTITVDGQTVLTSATGQPLTESEEATVRSAVEYYDGSLDLSSSLLVPLS
ncbi:MAG TPA: hypothetical protein VH763_11395 [Gemmatimonadales bacterium]|jgi:hypothetical protein